MKQLGIISFFKSIVSLENCLLAARSKQSIPDDKFDNHIRKARLRDTESSKSAFVLQSESNSEREASIAGIAPPVY